MSNHIQQRVYSDGEILDLIEDFLVNHFAEEVPEAPASELFDMLTHVCHLVELRSSKHKKQGPDSVSR